MARSVTLALFAWLLPLTAAAQATPAQPPAQTPAPQTPTAQAPPAPADPQTPVFRAGVDLIPVDVTVVDGQGRQVKDLAVAEFQVEINGKPRRLVSAEYVALTSPLPTTPRPAPARFAGVPEREFYTSNLGGGPRGRSIMLLVDQGNIRAGGGRAVMRTAAAFVDRLAPIDRVAIVAVPAPGELVDFTTEHYKAREALLRIVGRANPYQGQFNISITEATIIRQHSDLRLLEDVVLRECGQLLGAGDLERCEREVEQEAAEIVSHQRLQTDDSLRGLRAVIGSLAAFEGPKTVVLVSEGLVLDALGAELDDIAKMAADARVSLDVLLLDVPRFTAERAQRNNTAQEDRDREKNGLEMLAGMTRGTLHQVMGAGENAFERIGYGLEGYYLLGIEADANDRGARRPDVKVRTTRKGLTINARRGFLAADVTAAATPEQAATRALRSPSPATALPVRLATWSYKEPGTERVRVLVAAEVERASAASDEFVAAIAIGDRDGKVVASQLQSTTLVPVVNDPEVLSFTSSVTLEPGSYRVRVALADKDRRVGSVERELQAYALDPEQVSLGDLLVAPTPDGRDASLVPAVEARVARGRLAVLAELYPPKALPDDRLAASLEVLRDAADRPVLTRPLRIAAGPTAEVRSAQGDVDIRALPPGRYLARLQVTEGGKPRGSLARPFRVVTPSAADAAAAASIPAAGAPGELRTAIAASLQPSLKDDVLTAAVMAPVWAAAERNRPAKVQAAVKSARAGQTGTAAMAAFEAGDQTVAAFIKGVDLLGKAQADQAAVQFQNAMRGEVSFAPARAMLGATFLAVNKPREAAGLLQSLPATDAPGFSRVAGEAWIQAGEPGLAVAPLEGALAASPDDAKAARALALAYALAGDADKAHPALAKHLQAQPADAPALAAGVYAIYQRHLTGVQPTLAADRAQAKAWAKAYGSGPLTPLVTLWIQHLDGLAGGK